MRDEEIIDIIAKGYEQDFSKIYGIQVSGEEEKLANTLDEKQLKLLENFKCAYSNIYKKQPKMIIEYTLKFVSRLNNYGVKRDTNPFFD